MDEHERSAHLLHRIAYCLDIPVEHFMQCVVDPSETSDVEPAAASQNASMQAHRLLQIYWSLPDQHSKDLAVRMIEIFAKEHDPD